MDITQCENGMRVKVTTNTTGHGFIMGQEVVLYDVTHLVSGGRPNMKGRADNGEWWWLSANDVSIIQPNEV